MFRSNLGVCPGVASVVGSYIRVCKDFFSTTTPVASSFLGFMPVLGPLLRFVGDVLPRGITVVVGFGVRQSFPFVLTPLGDAGCVSTVAQVR